MSVPSKPSFFDIPGAINKAIDNLQGAGKWASDKVDQIQGQDLDKEFQEELERRRREGNILKELRQLKAEVDQNKRQLINVDNKAEKALQKYEKVFTDIARISADLANKTKQIALIKLDIELLKKGLAAIPGLVASTVKFVVASIIASAVFDALVKLGIGAFTKGGKIDLTPILAKIQKATDDARAAATIAVKAEGKADKALDEIKFVTGRALEAMKRLENLTKTEIKFLTESTRNALVRLQDRIKINEGLFAGLKAQFEALKITVGAIQSQLGRLQNFVTEKLKGLSNTVEALKTNLLKQIGNLKLDVGKIFGQLATFAAQIAGITLTIAGIQALLGRLRPGGTVVQNTYITNNYDQRRTTVVNNPVQQPVDLTLLKKIDNTTTTNLGVSTATYGLNQTMNTKLGDQIFGKGGKAIGIGGKLVSGLNWLIVDRAMNILTLAATIHNAGMLSQNIIITLTQSMQNIVDLVGVKDDQDNPVEISTLINNSISNFAKAVIGKENYENIIKQWNYYNRIYQSAANLFNSLMNMGDTIVNACNVISGQNSKVANALRLWGVVGEKAYGWMNPTPNFGNPFLTKLQSLDETASTVEQVSREPLNVKSAKEQLQADSEELSKTLAQKPGSKQSTEIPEAETVKAEFEAGKTASKGVDLEPEDKVEDDS